MSRFAELGLSPAVLAAVEGLGFEEPTPIQEQSIPVLRRGRDLIGQAQTGSGKTAAFGLPAIEYVVPSQPDVQVLVLVPTRELAIQVAQALRTFGESSGIRVIAVFGGQPVREQTEQLKREPHIAVGTPGRVMDLIRRGWLPLHDARYVVLDEADEMLSLGFLDDVEWILRRTPAGRQTMLFSATMPAPIRRLADRYLLEPELVRVASPTLTVESVRQVVIEAEPREKLDVLCRLIEREQPGAAIIFRRRKSGVDELANHLRARGVDVNALHGDMTQGQRDSVMLRFRSGRARLLVATNVAARGLDISHVSHVISYDVPEGADEYTHRIGRTGRVGRSGLAFTFVTRREQKKVEEIERGTGAPIERLVAADILNGSGPIAVATAAVRVAATVEAAIEPAVAPVETVAPSIASTAVEPVATNGALPERVRLFANIGRRHGIRRAELVAAIRQAAGVDPLRTVVHHAFSLVDVPADDADTALAALDGLELGGRAMRVERAERQPEPEPQAA